MPPQNSRATRVTIRPGPSALGEEALTFACNVLKPGGNFVIKSFQGADFPELLGMIKEHFHAVKTYSTKATRKGSTEIYIIAKNFKG